ncbi:AMP-binding protein [Spirosoma koreense]
MNTGFRARWYQLTRQFANHDAICHTSRRITYGQLAEQANGYARQLTDLGIRHSCVPVLIDSPVDHITALLGILLSGNYYYSVNPERALLINPTLKSVGALALIGTTSLVNPALLPDSLMLIQPDTIQPHPLGPSKVVIEPTTPFCLFTTSGTTGEPKQVIHSHQSVLTDTDRQISDNQIGPADRIDLLFSLEFSASLACVFPALLTGATLVIHNLKKEGVLSLPAFWQREQISFSTLSVSTFRLLLKSEFDFKLLDRLRFLSIGAEPVHRRDIEGFQAQFGQQTTLQIAYATTETRTITEQKIRTDTLWDSTLASVGKPITGRTVRIQAETGNWLEPGQVGEIVVQATSIPFGYANNPVASQQAYQRQVDGLVSYASGDLGYLDKAGHLFWCGRTDFMIKKNGQKINLLELEDVLGQAPGVLEVAVVSDPNAALQPFIRAFLRSDSTLELTTVKRWMAERLPNVMLPDVYQSIPELPRTRTGKIDRTGLLHQHPIARSTNLASSHFPTISLVDQIKTIWAQTLNYPEPIADYDDFFRDLGGDSLTAEACLATLEAQVGMSLPMQLAFSYPTPQALAAFITTPPETGVQRISLNQPVVNRPNIYFIPPLSGDKRIYLWLEKALGDHANLYCLYFSPFTESGQLRPLPALYDSLARLIDTSAPNLLIGYSFGGILAYEIALRLDRQSPQHQLNRLVLVDTPLYKRYPFTQVIIKDINRGWHKIQRVFTASETFRWSTNIQQLVVRYWSRLQAITPPLPLSDWQQKAEFAAQTYSRQVVVSTPVERPIVLFRATDTSYYQQDIKPDYKWHAFTRAGLEEHLLTTNHYHVLNQSNSEQIVLVLRRILVS